MLRPTYEKMIILSSVTLIVTVECIRQAGMTKEKGRRGRSVEGD